MNHQNSVYSSPSPKSTWALGWIPGSSKPVFSLIMPSSGPCQRLSQVLRLPSTCSPFLLLTCLPSGVSMSYCDLHSQRHLFHAADRQRRWDTGKRTRAASQVSSPERPNIPAGSRASTAARTDVRQEATARVTNRSLFNWENSSLESH